MFAYGTWVFGGEQASVLNVATISEVSCGPTAGESHVLHVKSEEPERIIECRQFPSEDARRDDTMKRDSVHPALAVCVLPRERAHHHPDHVAVG